MSDVAASALDDVVTDTATVATGVNVGHRGRALAMLRELLRRDGVAIERSSAEILTRPVGVVGQPDFHNQVLRLRAPQAWTARRWMEHCRAAEWDAGRRPTYHWGPRRADVDILLLGREGELVVATGELTVPHPEIRNRLFVQRLLAEIGSAASSGPVPRSAAGPRAGERGGGRSAPGGR